MKITIKTLEFPLSVKERIMKISKISKLNLEFVLGININFEKTIFLNFYFSFIYKVLFFLLFLLKYVYVSKSL